MNYTEAIDWLYATQGVGIKLGLENIERLLMHLGLPCYPHTPSHAPIVHVAGTNGKGSVCAMLDAICRAAGLRTGLFTSPHLVTYRERIRLNGEMIPEEAVARWLTRLRHDVAGWEHPPTFFELTTAMAMAWFVEKGAEVIILETGLGGRLDSSNALPPAVTLLTPISLDHQQYLGNTLRSIAAEKAGIIKEGTPVISAPQSPEAAEVIESTARLLGEIPTWITAPLTQTSPAQQTQQLGLAGSHQRWNAALAVEGVRLLAGKLSPALQPRLSGSALEKAIANGLRDVCWPGRFQRIRHAATGVEIILDGAHNIAAAEQLLLTWSECYGEARPSILLGALSDKDVSAIVRILAPFARRFLFVPVRNPRTASPQMLAELAHTYAPGVPGTCYNSMNEALEAFTSEAGDDRLLITGSLFLVGDALASLENAARDPVSMQ